MKRIEIIIPCCNEEDNIELVLRAVDRYMKPLEYQYGFLFVDDGSTAESSTELSSGSPGGASGPG